MGKKNDKAIGDMVQAINSMCNNYSYNEQANLMMEALRRSHPTGQQNFWRMICKTIILYGEVESNDLRNDKSIKWCKKLSEHLKDSYFPTI